MTEPELFDALDGLSAYDAGCTDSGIRDELLRRRVFQYLGSLTETEQRLTLGKHIREHYLTDEAMAQGYGPEDVQQFLNWLDDQPWPRG